MSNPKAFLSYTWEDEAHREWVRSLAEQLRRDGVETILDRWHAVPGDQLPQFMESSVREAEFVLIVCTQSYKHKSDARKGGVGYEGDIMTAEVFVSGNRRKFVPILRKGPWETAAPSWLLGTYYLDFSDDSNFQSSYSHLVARLLGQALPAPPVAVVRFSRHADGSVTDNKSGLMWGLPHDDREYEISEVSDVLADCPHGYDDWRLPTREEISDLKAAMDGYFPPPVTLYSKVYIQGFPMDKGPWNRETLEEESQGSGVFNPSFIPEHALAAMAESASRLIRPVRTARNA